MPLLLTKATRTIMKSTFTHVSRFYRTIGSIGVDASFNDYEKRKLAIFNVLNFFGLITGIIIPVAGMFSSGYLPPLAWIIACSPFFISAVVLLANHYRNHVFAQMWYFISYPIVTLLVYAGSINVGIELFFVLYAVLAVYFLNNLKQITMVISFSVICYFMTFAVNQEYQYKLEDINFSFFIFNHVLSLVFIFFGIFLTKKENQEYQQDILAKNEELNVTNIAINKQAVMLEKQAKELGELNTVKNKLFSVISHDLKTPIYALRNLFKTAHEHDVPAEEIKVMIPEVVNDLNYTTSLMENLLQWAKTQMQSDAVKPQLLNISEVTSEVMQVLRRQAEAKQIYLQSKIEQPVYVYADKDMLNLVLRNLLSNAIKFTPEKGCVSIGANEDASFVEVFVEDTGTGIDADALEKINACDYFTTKGTANEGGTGLGLMLCKEFLAKNGGRMFVESEVGIGSTFSFMLPASHN